MRAMGGHAVGVCSAEAERVRADKKDRVRLRVWLGTAAPKPRRSDAIERHPITNGHVTQEALHSTTRGRKTLSALLRVFSIWTIEAEEVTETAVFLMLLEMKDQVPFIKPLEPLVP
jgi:hypothetical protein